MRGVVVEALTSRTKYFAQRVFVMDVLSLCGVVVSWLLFMDHQCLHDHRLAYKKG